MSTAGSLSPQRGASTNPQAERRAYVRFPCDREITCQTLAGLRGDQEKWLANVRDISVGGVGFVIDRRFEKGTALVIELADQASASSRILLARVARVNAHGLGTWFVGCTFTNKLTDDELQALL
jgi:hypothetical protein